MFKSTLIFLISNLFLLIILCLEFIRYGDNPTLTMFHYTINSAQLYFIEKAIMIIFTVYMYLLNKKSVHRFIIRVIRLVKSN